MNIFSISILKYFLIVGIIAGLPLVFQVFSFKFPKVIIPIYENSAVNLDTGENNQYTISGQIGDYSPLVRIFPIKYYQVFGLRFPWLISASVNIADSQGHFQIGNLPAGEYFILAVKKIQLKTVILKIRDHNPLPIRF